MFCLRAGPSLQAQEHRLQFCRRQVFHRKHRNQDCSFTRDWIGVVASRCFPAPDSLCSIWTDLKRSEKIPGAPTWRWGERFWLTVPSGLYQNEIQSHLYIRPGNRRLSLAALPGLPAASRGSKLPLLADTRSVFSHCNTGNFVNTPVRVDKNTSRR